MNPIDENTPISEDYRFDLLVDGELSEPKRRELLCGLEEEPGGWRRCALAFLEAQSWKREFGAIAGGPAGQRSAKGPARWPRLGGPTGTLLAMAASFVGALLLVGVVQGVWRSGSPTGGPKITARPPVEVPASPAPEQKPVESPPEAPTEQPARASEKVYLVELSGPGGEGQTVELPAVERDQVDMSWSDGLPRPISPEILKILEQAGLRVERRRDLLPFRMKDGRQLVVPVDEVDIHYVGKPTL